VGVRGKKKTENLVTLTNASFEIIVGNKPDFAAAKCGVYTKTSFLIARHADGGA
jgi:hypothetical protein